MHARNAVVASAAPMALSLVLAAASPAPAQLVGSLGGDIIQGDTTSVPDVAALPAGGFVVARTASDVAGPDQGEIVAQIYAAPETAVGTEFQINTFTTGAQEGVRLASNGAGTFVAVWESSGHPGGTEVRGRLYDATGTALTAEFAVNAYTTGTQFDPAVSMGADGSFVVAWSGEHSADTKGISVRKYDAGGSPATSDILVFTPGPFLSSGVVDPSVAVLADGGFIVAYNDLDSDFVLGRRYDAAAAPTTGVVVLGDPAFGSLGTDVVALPDGGFAAGWDFGAQRFDATGLAVGPEITPDDDIHGLGRDEARLAAAANGDLLIAFGKGTDPFSSFGGTVLTNFARRYDAAGTPQTSSFLLFDDQTVDMTSIFSSNLNVTRLTSGSFVAAAGTLDHSEFTGDPIPEGAIHIRRICDLAADPTCDICPGFDDSLDADGDGRPDGCDACHNTGGQAMLEKTRIGIRNPERIYPIRSKKNKLNWTGSFVIPVPFSSTDPETQGARIRVEAVGGSTLVDVALAGGTYAGRGTAGWTTNAAGTKVRYLDRTASPVNGITQVTFADRSNQQPGLVQIKVKGFGGSYPVSSVYIPVRGSIVLGDETAGASGACGEVSFALEDCTTTPQRLACEL